jgi:peptide/nickel transport system permease protein
VAQWEKTAVIVGRYFVKRILVVIPTVVLSTIVVFLLLRLLPGDAVFTMLSDTPHSLEMRAALRNELGLDKPAAVQYLTWLRRMFDGSFGGRSFETGDSISSMIGRQLPVTFLLSGYTILISFVWALPFGAWAGSRPGTLGDKAMGVFSLAGLSVPNILAASIVLLGLLKIFKWSPPIIYSSPVEDFSGHLQMMLWPVLILSLEYGSHLLRVVRTGVAETMKKPFILGAKARGTSPRALILRHAAPPITVLTLSVAGTQFGVLIGGALVVEAIFGLPGIGRGLIQAALARDFPVIQSYTVLLVSLYLVVNVCVDLLHGFIDPRLAHNAPRSK